MPPQVDLETKSILKKLATAHRYLAELKGVSASIPNHALLINTLTLQEAKDSSAIENIITTHDELYKGELFPEFAVSASAKEVSRYAMALRTGFEFVQKHQLITNQHILKIQAELEMNDAGFRRQVGTVLKNEQTGEIIYTPPQDPEQILRLMKNLEIFINDDSFYDMDPLIKMAIIHYQFESIHPFYDGNGRTGRILNVLYLVQKKLLEIPILYMSHSIIRSKDNYYRLLQQVRTHESWEEWVLYMLGILEDTAKQTIHTINQVKDALMDYKHRIRDQFKFYSQDLINNLFFHPYTRISFVMKDLGVQRITATKYLDALSAAGFLKKEKIGQSNYYINVRLFEILTQAGKM